MRSRQVAVEGQLFQVTYDEEITEQGPLIHSVYAIDQGIEAGPNLVTFLDPMYFRQGDTMTPVLSLIALDIMSKEFH
jgi:hypothetical protein